MSLSFFFDNLARSGLLRGSSIDSAAIQRVPLSTIFDISDELSEITMSHHMDETSEMLLHSASPSLGGSRKTCQEFSCRTDRLYEMSQFALLYSDRIYINNFLSHSITGARGSGASEDRIRQMFAEECALMAFIRPLIEAEKVVPFTPQIVECPICLSKRGTPTPLSRRLEAHRNHLASRYLNEVQYTVHKDASRYVLVVSGPLNLLAHGSASLCYPSIPTVLRDHPQLVSRVENGEQITLSKQLRAQTGFPEQMATDVQCDLGFELTAAEKLGTAFLTDQELHVGALNEIVGDPELVRRNNIAQQHLTTILPFVTHVSLSDLLTLRRREEEAFILYRRELNKALGEYKNAGETFDESDARQIYQDLIAPSVARIERGVQLAKRDLLRTPARKGAGMVAALSFGIYSGLVPPSLTAAATALGAGKIVADVTEQWLQGRDIERNVRNDPMYFLWRVAKLGKKSESS